MKTLSTILLFLCITLYTVPVYANIIVDSQYTPKALKTYEFYNTTSKFSTKRFDNFTVRTNCAYSNLQVNYNHMNRINRLDGYYLENNHNTRNIEIDFDYYINNFGFDISDVNDSYQIYFYNNNDMVGSIDITKLDYYTILFSSDILFNKVIFDFRCRNLCCADIVYLDNLRYDVKEQPCGFFRCDCDKTPIPTPEPPSVFLLLSGLLFMLFFINNKKLKQLKMRGI